MEAHASQNFLRKSVQKQYCIKFTFPQAVSRFTYLRHRVCKALLQKNENNRIHTQVNKKCQENKAYNHS